jgi:signal recognition particle subunit SRP54
MFSSITNTVTDTFDTLLGKKTLSTSDVNEALEKVRVALLNADVALPVVEKFLEEVRSEAIGETVIGRQQQLPKAATVFSIVGKRLQVLLGTSPVKLEFMQEGQTATPPYNILMTGTQGSGKTTTSAKLALYLQNRKYKVLLVSLDTHRAAAREQLERLSKQIGVDCLSIIPNETPLQIAQRALDQTKNGQYQVCIFDTAGRMQVDNQLMTELEQVSQLVNPVETLLCADAMLGNEAVNIAQEFHNRFKLSGIILSRLDGDVRGGAAISMRATTGVPIKFIGTGERLEDLDPFVPQGLSQRIMGEGDIGTLAQKAQEMQGSMNEEQILSQFKTGKFTFDDYLDQLSNMRKLGSVKSMMGSLGMGNNGMDQRADGMQQALDLHSTILSHLKPEERERPSLFLTSSQKRIELAKKADVSLMEINKMLKMFSQVQETSARMSQFSNKAKEAGKTVDLKSVMDLMKQDPEAAKAFTPKVRKVMRRR